MCCIIFFQLQETGNAEDIVPFTLIKDCSESQQLNSDERDYFRQYQEREQKFLNFEAIVSNLTSPQKHKVLNRFSKRHSSTKGESAKEYQSLVCDKVIFFFYQNISYSVQTNNFQLTKIYQNNVIKMSETINITLQPM